MVRTPHLRARDFASTDAFIKQREAKIRGYCPHKPHPRQQEFLDDVSRDVLFGGAAGGGKSDALLMAYLQYAHVPGYSGLIVRRTFQDLYLPGAIGDRAQQWLANTDVRENKEMKTHLFPSGARLTMGYLDVEKDRLRYQSSEFQFVGVDEATQIPWGWQRYLFSRLRKPADGPLSKVPLRYRAATNPGGISHEAVRRHYVDPKTAKARFIASKLADNPSLDQDSYLLSLSELDEHTRKQLQDGEWVRDANNLVYHLDETKNRIPALPKSNGNEWFFILSLDFGVTNATSYTVLAYRMADPRVYVLHSHKKRGQTSEGAAVEIRALMQRWHFSRMIGDIGGLGKAFAEELRRRYAFPIEPAQKSDKRGFIRLINGALEQLRIVIVGDECEQLIDELATLPWKDEEQEEEAKGFDNHCADGLLYGWRACPNFHELVPGPLPNQQEALENEMHKYWERTAEQLATTRSKQWWET